MVDQRKRLVLFQLSIAIIGIILLSAGLSRVNFLPGRSLHLLEILLQDMRPADTAPPTVEGGGSPSLGLLAPVFWAVLIFSIIFAATSPRYRKLLLRTFVILVFLLIILDRLPELNPRQNEAERLESGGGALDQPEYSLPDPPDFVANPPGWLRILFNVALGILLLGVIWVFWRRLRPRPDVQTLLVQEAEQALTELRVGSDVKNVVLRCYARMSQVLRQNRNIERHQAMTPREFERHLVEIGLRDEHIQRLTRLFEGARYGASPTGGRAEREAMDCLYAIVRAYGDA